MVLPATRHQKAEDDAVSRAWASHKRKRNMSISRGKQSGVESPSLDFSYPFHPSFADVIPTLLHQKGLPAASSLESSLQAEPDCLPPAYVPAPSDGRRRKGGTAPWRCEGPAAMVRGTRGLPRKAVHEPREPHAAARKREPAHEERGGEGAAETSDRSRHRQAAMAVATAEGGSWPL